MFDKKKKDESELEDTKVAEEVTPGGIEIPQEEGAKEVADSPTPEKEVVEPEAEEVCETCEAPVAKKDPSVFTERVLLGVELIKSKSLEEVIEILDYQLKAIRNLAVEKITEYKS